MGERDVAFANRLLNVFLGKTSQLFHKLSVNINIYLCLNEAQCFLSLEAFPYIGLSGIQAMRIRQQVFLLLKKLTSQINNIFSA